MSKQHPYIINTSEKAMDDTYEFFRKKDIERAAEEIAQAMEPEEVEMVAEAEENLYGAPARERYH